MTAEEALARVRTIYAEAGRALSEDVSVRSGHIRTAGWFCPRKKTWVVWTNTTQRGGNHIFEFDAESGELLKDFVLPR
jgi:hypothetical protein